MHTNPHPLINSADLEAELAAIAAEAIGWHPLANVNKRTPTLF